MTTTETVSASQVRERVVERIIDLRNPNRHRDHARAVAAYKRTLGKRAEVIRRGNLLGGVQFFPATPDGIDKAEREDAKLGGKSYDIGFNRLVNGVPEWVPRPRMATPWTYYHSGGYKVMDEWVPVRDAGILTDSAYNRDIRHQRVVEFAAIMEAGEWRDLLSDPFAITADGQVVNGQHRIAACEDVDWTTVDNDPQFLVIWDVDRREALHADGSRRTPNDQTTIARKLATA